jgi:FMN phosphatase YigB (HAD superfamily)
VFFERILDELGCDAGELADVGDRVDNDVVPAAACGLVAMFLRRGPWGHVQATWPEADRARLRIECLDERPAALASLS